MSRFYETLLLVRVLHDRAIVEPMNMGDVWELAKECCDEGDFTGEVVSCNSRRISTAHMGELLVKTGDEPEFFDIPDLVQVVETLRDGFKPGDVDLTDLLQIAEVHDRKNRG